MTVKIYTAPTCIYCHMAKAYFRRNDIPFIEYDVSADRMAAAEMISKTGQMGVPVIEVNGNIIIGFDKHAIEAALQTQD